MTKGRVIYSSFCPHSSLIIYLITQLNYITCDPVSVHVITSLSLLWTHCCPWDFWGSSKRASQVPTKQVIWQLEAPHSIHHVFLFSPGSSLQCLGLTKILEEPPYCYEGVHYDNTGILGLPCTGQGIKNFLVINSFYTPAIVPLSLYLSPASRQWRPWGQKLVLSHPYLLYLT